MTTITYHILRVAAFLCCAVIAEAQSARMLPDLHDQQSFMQGQAAMLKGSVAVPRLLARSYYAPQNGALAPIDSSEMSYAAAIATNVSSQTTYKYNIGKWYPSSRYNYSYDNSGNNLQTDYQTWSATNGVYQNLVRYNYSFNAANAKTALLYEIWNAAAAKYVNGIAEVYTLNGRNDVVDMMQQIWSTSANAWTNSLHTTYTYTAPGAVQEVIEQSWNTSNSTWLNTKRKMYVYDASGKHVSSDTSYQWDGSHSMWQYTDRDIYTLNAAGKPTAATTENYRVGDSTWLSNSEDNYTYNSIGNALTSIHMLWNDMAASYLNNLNTGYTYNKTGLLTVINTKTWDGTAWTVGIGSERTTNYYEGDNQLNVASNAGAKLDITAMPIPATDILHISLTGLLRNANATLTDMRGQLQGVYALSGNKTDIPVRDMPAGSYCLSVKDNEGTSATRIIIIAH